MSDISSRFYQPIFGNDNVYAPEVMDIVTFSAPLANTAPTPAPHTQAKKHSKQAS